MTFAIRSMIEQIINDLCADMFHPCVGWRMGGIEQTDKMGLDKYLILDRIEFPPIR